MNGDANRRVSESRALQTGDYPVVAEHASAGREAGALLSEDHAEVTRWLEAD